MFGYVAINGRTLSPGETRRFRAFYCGLCRALQTEYGSAGRLTLSNDMTFLSLLLCALYEPPVTERAARCALHPLKKHPEIAHEAASFAAGMNVILAYHKRRDDERDEGGLRAGLGRKMLEKPYHLAREQYPEIAREVGEALAALSALEAQPQPDLDALARLSGRMLGACFVWKKDAFAPWLRGMGEALGRFIYLMDAYEDFDADKKRGQFNPLSALHAQSDYEARMEEILTFEMAECARYFELLPIEQDAELLRNILYSGVWGRYAALHQHRKETK
ncbi:MAG: hypothetical protein IJS53_05195 [Clostridia bacterium]|nr:hypothetical protein [Clostridia bacterium]